MFEFLIIILFLFLFFFAVPLLFQTFFTVKQQTYAVLEFFGKFSRIVKPGLNVKVPFLEKVVGRVNMKIQQLNVDVETKTKDNVFVKVTVAVQYYVLENKVYEAFYRLDNTQAQITAFVFDVVRSRVPGIILDELFENKDEIAIAVKSELSQVMDDFGYGIVKTLVTDIDPDSRVKTSMNEINAAQRLRVASEEKGEADKILKVKLAEADAESKALSGKGIADQRRAIINGLRDSVDDFQRTIPGTDAKEVMNLVLITQYFDTLKEIGTSSNKGAIFVPHSPGAVAGLADEIRSAMMQASQVENITK